MPFPHKSVVMYKIFPHKSVVIWQLFPHESVKDEEIYIRQYYFTGGIPEAVKTYCATKDLIAVRTIQKNILAAYEADIAKHTASETQRVRMVWQSVPELKNQRKRENIFEFR